jgi:wyosine [tRNA(Phe)-imidazoG37] synthetase (radical SAM superfamily)
MPVQSQEVANLKCWELVGQTVYGPIWSRRFKLSLGINLLPNDRKVCNFDCLYCQCGWTDRAAMLNRFQPGWLPTLDEIEAEVTTRFKHLYEEAILPDWIIFSGNGEPTLHPDFPQAVAIVEKYRHAWLPDSRLGILTNGTGLSDPQVFQSICRMQSRVIKLDAGLERVNRPFFSFDLDSLIPIWARVPNLTIQSFFCEGRFDNTGEKDVALWIEQIRRVNPRRVQIYSLDREPAAPEMEKASLNRMTQIARRVVEKTGVAVSVFE